MIRLCKCGGEVKNIGLVEGKYTFICPRCGKKYTQRPRTKKLTYTLDGVKLYLDGVVVGMIKREFSDKILRKLNR